VKGNIMTPEQTLISEALAEIDERKTVRVIDMLNALLTAVEDIDKDVDRIEFNADSFEIASGDGDGTLYIGVYRPSEIDENIQKLKEIIAELTLSPVVPNMSLMETEIVTE
jgi:hypothetical protein